MLTTHKTIRSLTKDKWPTVDFRLLNTHIMCQNTTTPLLGDIVSISGSSKCETASSVDGKDVFHSIRPNAQSKEYCGSFFIFRRPHYQYEVLLMDLAISPAKWMGCINLLLEITSYRPQYIAIMYDLVLSLRKHHMDRLESLCQVLVNPGLKLSSKKCQFVYKKLVYLDNLYYQGPENDHLTS